MNSEPKALVFGRERTPQQEGVSSPIQVQRSGDISSEKFCSTDLGALRWKYCILASNDTRAVIEFTVDLES